MGRPPARSWEVSRVQAHGSVQTEGGDSPPPEWAEPAVPGWGSSAPGSGASGSVTKTEVSREEGLSPGRCPSATPTEEREWPGARCNAAIGRGPELIEEVTLAHGPAARPI